MAKDNWDIEMGEPDSWNYHREFMNDDEFYTLVRAAHASQTMYPPFDGAYSVLDALNREDYEVIVASHREPQTAGRLAEWLRRYGLEPYSGLYTGRDKHFLIGAGDLVIDDAPQTIEKACSMGARVLTLTYKYNRHKLHDCGNRNKYAPQGFHTLAQMAVWLRAHTQESYKK